MIHLRRAVHVVHPDAHSPPVSLELFDLGKLHHRLSDIAEPLSRQVRARNVLDEGGEVDTRILLGIAIRR